MRSPDSADCIAATPTFRATWASRGVARSAATPVRMHSMK